MNIELHGFLPEHATRTRELIWGKLDTKMPREEALDYAVTIVQDRPCECHGRNAPFIRIFSDKKSDFLQAKKFLKEIDTAFRVPKMPVEFVLLADYTEL